MRNKGRYFALATLFLVAFLFLLTFSTLSTVVVAQEQVVFNSFSGAQNTVADATIPDHEVILNVFQTQLSNEFVAQQQLAAVEVCGCESYSNTLSLTNTGDLYDVYSLQSSGENAQWTTLAPAVFELAPGETKQITQYTKVPCGTEGIEQVNIDAQSRYNGGATITQDVYASTCANANLFLQNNHYTTCPCTPTAYKATVVNTASYTDTFDLFVNNGLDKDYYRLSKYIVTLQPGMSEDIFVYIKQPCDVYGTYVFDLQAQARSTEIITQVPLSMDILQACYTYDVVLGEMYAFDAQQTEVDIPFTPKEEYAYEICEGESAVILANVRNPSNIINQYNVLLDAGSFMSASPLSLALIPGQEELVSLLVQPKAGDAGQYLFSLDLNAIRGDLHTVVPFSMQVVDCAAPATTSWWTWAILGFILLLLLLLLLALLYLAKKRKENKEGLAKPPKAAKTAGKKSKKVSSTKEGVGKSFWKWLIPILLLLLLLFGTVGWFAYPKVKAKLAEGIAQTAPVSNPVDTLLPWYFDLLILILLLALLFLLLLFGRKLWNWLKQKWKSFRKKGFKVKKLKKEKSPFWNAQRKKKWLKWLKWLGILLLLLLLLGMVAAGVYFGSKEYGKWKATQADENKKLLGDLEENVKDLKDEIEGLNDVLSEKEKEIFNNDLNKIRDDLDEIQDDLDDLETSGEESEQEKQDLQDELSTLEEELNEIKDAVDTTDEMQKERTEDLKKAVEDLAERVNELGDGLDDEPQLDPAVVAALQEQLQSLEDQIAEKEQELNDLELQLIQHIQDAASGDSEAQQEIQNLHGQMENLENEIQSLRNDHQNLQDQIDALEGRVTTLEDDVDDIKNRLDALENQVTNILVQVDVMENEQPEPQDVSEIEERVEEVKEEVEQIKFILEEPLDEDVPENFKTILALDMSLSTLAKDNGIVRADTIKEQAQRYVIGEKVTVMVIGINPVLVRQNIRGDIAKRVIRNLLPISTKTNVEAAMKRADRILGNDPGRIVVISDLIHTQGGDPYEAKKELEEKGREVIFIDVRDLAPVMIEQAPVFVINDQPVEVVGTVDAVVEDAEEEAGEQPEETTEEAEEETGEQPEGTEGAEEEPLVEEPVVESTTTPQPKGYELEIPKNGKVFIDLKKHFKDIDNDDLTYSISPMENIDTLLKDGVVTFLPKKDFVGDDLVTFTADDGKEGVTSSPEITVKVLDVPGKSWTNEDFKKLLPLIITLVFMIFLYQITKDSDKKK
jgi:predicted  nucleic acid-binding Zn-ribbon protein